MLNFLCICYFAVLGSEESMYFTNTLLAFNLQVRWGHIEDVELVNDGSGLGFGIVGGKSSGVVVRTIVPGGLADRVS